MIAVNKTPHKAKPTNKGRKYGRNFPRHTRASQPHSKYVLRKRRDGTFKVRKSRANGA